ncbi:MAG: 6-bladed beta-propeller [Gemmatimonadales bacterium]|nr:6-bladed beta-propeller [Gemmatimonadales bacterium]NIP08571.1 6-bladed beta-propeller [Gemmatimonadales bacterium]NIQ99108.1 6-bladed beta-propeller [Gemmatimonadales bacterium]NIS66078.1 6-bladed beta-propeller [Gemmatimonadales bacterium]
MRKTVVASALAFAAWGFACREAPHETAWRGTIDTLPSGTVVVSNTSEPIWSEGGGWRVIEEVRIGRVEGDGPDVFGRVTLLDVDRAGRIWVFEAQAQEIRIFSADGSFLRTVGGRGGGPGEFIRAAHMQTGPGGHVWLLDPGNDRLSEFDTAGTFLGSRHSPGGFMMTPWPGGFAGDGFWHYPIAPPSEAGFRVRLVRCSADLQPIDTADVPTDPKEREPFVHPIEDYYLMASVPFSGGFRWRLSPSGTIWGMVTDDYKFFELSFQGDTLLTFTREFTPLLVTESDIQGALEDLEWFTDEGGNIDRAKIPSRKPATEDFFFDDQGNIWVVPVSPPEDYRRTVDVFDPSGRYLGTVRLPFRFSRPYPVIRNDTMYAVTTDLLDVPYVVRARIEKP